MIKEVPEVISKFWLKWLKETDPVKRQKQLMSLMYINEKNVTIIQSYLMDLADTLKMKYTGTNEND